MKSTVFIPHEKKNYYNSLMKYNNSQLSYNMAQGACKAENYAGIIRHSDTECKEKWYSIFMCDLDLKFFPEMKTLIFCKSKRSFISSIHRLSVKDNASLVDKIFFTICLPHTNEILRKQWLVL